MGNGPAKGLGVIWGIFLVGLVLLLPGSAAQADKVAEPMVFDADNAAIAIVSLYETDPATQADAVKSFYKTAKSFYKTIPGFYGWAVFSSTDGSRVLELSQWQDQASYDNFHASLVSGGGSADYTKYYEQYAGGKDSKDKEGKGKGGNETVDLGEPFLTMAFAIDQVISPPGMVSAIPGATALVQISDMATDTAEHQADLVAVAHSTLADLSQLYPAPRTTVLLTGIDTTHIALLTHWGSAAEFTDLEQVPQIALMIADDEAETLSLTTDTHLYKAIKVITPKTKQYGKD
ncbi:MAG: hypothetical protein ACFCVB_21260 [Nodosilinea sp.]